MVQKHMYSHESYLKTRASREGDANVEMTEEHWKVTRPNCGKKFCDSLTYLMHKHNLRFLIVTWKNFYGSQFTMQSSRARVTLLADLIYIMLQIGYWTRDSWAKYFIALGYNLPSLLY